MLQVYVYNTGKGFVNSVAQANPVLWVYALGLYCFLGGASWYLIRQKRRMSEEIEKKAISEMCAEEYGRLIGQIEVSLCFCCHGRHCGQRFGSRSVYICAAAVYDIRYGAFLHGGMYAFV